MIRRKRCESSSLSFLLFIQMLQFHRLSRAWRCSNVTMHWHPASLWTQRKRSTLVCFKLSWLSLTGLREHSPHGKHEGFTYFLFYVCTFIQLYIMFMFWVICLFLKSRTTCFFFPLTLLSTLSPAFKIVLLQFGIPGKDGLHTQCLCSVL